MMTSREMVARTIRFQSPERLAMDLPDPYGSDIVRVDMSPSPDYRPDARQARDEWGTLWQNIGVSNLGEVKDVPLKSWDDFAALTIPDINDESRWTPLAGTRQRYPDKFILGTGISLYERIHFLRGLENTWIDIYDAPERLGQLLDILVQMNITAIERYAAMGLDGYMWADDWGLQNRLMIAPEKWRELWKPCYARVYRAAHDAGLATVLHSCGYIVDILDDLIEIGLDVIQMDQQENMGLELLGSRFAGRITFYCPVDIQNTMARGDTHEIRHYCHRMVSALRRPEGGFIADWYKDPTGAGHHPQALAAMCEEFLDISRKIQHANLLEHKQ